MMTIFLADGKMDMIKIIKAAMDNLMYNTPTWVVPTPSGIYGKSVVSTLPGGINIIEYKGPQPRIVKL
jgi:hypothetical protein